MNRELTKKVPIGALLVCAWLCCEPADASASPLLAQEEQQEAQAAEESEVSLEDDVDARWTAVVGGDVYTGLGEVLRGATVLSKDGKIHAIGYDLWIPPGTEKLDAHGLRVYPGMVALSASSRVTQGTLAPADEGQFLAASGADAEIGFEEEWVDDWGPAPDEAAKTKAEDKGILDDYDPFSPYLIMTLGSGITTVEQSGAAVKLRSDSIEDVLIADDNLVTTSFGSGESRARTREDFARAAEYLREYRAWQDAGDKEAAEPSKRGVNSGVLRVLEGKGRARFNASEREELLGIARLAQTYGFRPVIFGGREGWVVADELGRAGATVVLTPRERQWKEEQLNAEAGSSIENAAKLHAAGVQIAVQPSSGSVDLGGIAGRDLLALMIEAGFAVRGGLSNQAALEAVTIVPARVLGADHRIGSLEVGKDADMVVTDGDLLHYETFVQFAVVGGELAYDKSDELYFAHIRPLEDSGDRISIEGEEQASEESIEPAQEDPDSAGDEEQGDDEQPDEESSDDEPQPEEGPEDRPEDGTGDKPGDKPEDGN